jgi:hypothetical protein
MTLLQDDFLSFGVMLFHGLAMDTPSHMVDVDGGRQRCCHMMTRIVMVASRVTAEHLATNLWRHPNQTQPIQPWHS